MEAEGAIIPPKPRIAIYKQQSIEIKFIEEVDGDGISEVKNSDEEAGDLKRGFVLAKLDDLPYWPGYIGVCNAKEEEDNGIDRNVPHCV